MSVIKTEKLNKSYGGHAVLKDVDIEIESGKIYGLLGRNGAGKSTLMNIISNRIFPTSGRVLLDGEELKENDKALSRIYAMNEAVSMPQLLTFKQAAKITSDFYSGFDMERAFEMAEKFGLSVNKRLSGLSTGYATVAKVILALASGAEFLFFDEPVLGLDANHRELFYRLLVERYAETGCAMVISTHIIEECENLIENVIMIDKGEIIENGCVEDILTNGYSVTGAAQAVEKFCSDQRVLAKRTVGPICSAYVKGKPENVPAGLEVSVPDLQQLFVSLTGEEAEK